MTPLSWCIVISTAANVATMALVGWFLVAKPFVHVSGEVNVYGGPVDVRRADDGDEIQKVQICDKTNCASLDAYTRFGMQSHGLSVVPAPN